MQQERTALYPPLEIRRGVLVVDGYGVKVHCLRGRLVLSDGIGPQRRSVLLHRATSKLKRLVLLGHEGFVTLEAIRWLDDVGASLIHVGRDGRLLATSATLGRDDPRLRRAQARAGGTETGTAIARSLLVAKLTGQARVAEQLDPGTVVRGAISSAISALDDASTPRDLMGIEGAAALAYWDAWSGVEVPFAKTDRTKVPEHWLTFDKRVSPLTGNPRLAGNPVNALLNYLYAILEAESRIACLAIGLDPGLGVLHADQPARDSLALDVMEAVRPDVDGYVLDLLQGHVFRARDFHETRQGVCRLLAPMTHHLAGTAVRWRRAVGPVVEGIARTLVEKPGSRARRVPTVLTQDNRSEGRDGQRRSARRTPRTAAAIPAACRSCGIALDSDRSYCDGCHAVRRVEQGHDLVASAHATLARMRAEGADPMASAEVRRRVAETRSEQARQDADWDREHDVRPDPEVFRSEILPGLQPIPLRAMAAATGLSVPHCGDIRRGHVPHPRHWDGLRRIASVGT